MEIRNNNFTLSVDQKGGYIVDYTLNGESIIYPKTEIVDNENNTKIRGGSHLCFPNFGKDDIYNLEQHGFARNINWEVEKVDESRIEMSFNGEGCFDGLVCRVTYEIFNDSLITKLDIENKSDKPVPIAPGFHPYFYSFECELKVVGKKIDYDKMLETEFIEGSQIEFYTTTGAYTIETTNCNSFAIWTDRLGDYVCVEPTYNGVCFNGSLKDCKLINPSEQFSMMMKITKVS